MITAHPARAADTVHPLGRILTAVAVPWPAFIGGFIYYVVLTLMAISVDQLPDGAMAAAYLTPLAAYLLVLCTRLLPGLARLARLRTLTGCLRSTADAAAGA